jgi:hypothetical protein
MGALGDRAKKTEGIEAQAADLVSNEPDQT